MRILELLFGKGGGGDDCIRFNSQQRLRKW